MFKRVSRLVQEIGTEGNSEVVGINVIKSS